MLTIPVTHAEVLCVPMTPWDYFRSLAVVQSPSMGPCENVVADVLSHEPGMALAHSDSALSGSGGTLCRPFTN